MKWKGNRESDNVTDARGSGLGGGFGGRSLGIGSVVIALVGSYFFGVSPATILNILQGGSAPMTQQAPATTAGSDDPSVKFVRVVLADTEDVWGEIFRENGGQYAQPELRLFSGQTPTACGTGSSASGPFYCPGDQNVYLDLEFFQTMRQRFQVASEFAQAYVIAHEVGHHVQNLTGIMDKVDAIRRKGNEREANALSVRVELQADCYAGVWAFHANEARSILESGDIESALQTASAIGDDTLQKQGEGRVVPDSFTHGTSAQRVRWFKRGIEKGQVGDCNTFAATQL